jgi:hypothetical protein
MFRKAKDAALSKLARLIANHLELVPMFRQFAIGRYGRVESFALNSTDKTLKLSLSLKGESQPVKIEARYRVVKKDSGKFLVIDSPVSSREWLNLLIRDYYRPEQSKIPLPPFTDMLL